MSRFPDVRDPEGLVFDMDSFAVHDGPGIRLAVYLKGCPLTCLWCHSPESQASCPEIVLVQDRCVLCGDCASACRQAAHVISDGSHQIDRSRCIACGQCVSVCAHRALSIKGERVRASEIIARAKRLRPFFEHSGGGVTLSGGEVTQQADFGSAVLSGCRQEGIHTAIETCGATNWERLAALVDLCDMVLYDIKLVDDELHRKWTGVSNRVILENLRRLAGYSVQVRVPLIPGITDTDENIGALYGLLLDVGLSQVGLLRYNAAAGAKYEWLGRCYEIDAEPQGMERLQELVDWAERLGLSAVVS